MLIDEKDMPAPRLELRWSKVGNTWKERVCIYALVMPLDKRDLRREAADTFTVEFGRTNVSADGRSPLNRYGGNTIAEPFREGLHARWDAQALGGLPVYIVCEGQAMFLDDE